MSEKMLIDASHAEETRVVVVRGSRIEEFDFESQHKKQIRGNIYLAKVTRVEPSLQAAFVDYGGNRHGFLAFAEIHPDYYQIPLADRQALLRAEAEEHRRDDDIEHVETAGTATKPAVRDDVADEQPDGAEPTVQADADAGSQSKPRRRAPRGRKKPVSDTNGTSEGVIAAVEGTDVHTSDADMVEDAVNALDTPVSPDDSNDSGSMAAAVETDTISEEVSDRRRGRNDDDDDDFVEQEKEVIESVGAEDAMEEVPDRSMRKPRKQYRIQEVIKRRQILLVQVAKEERGNKGAALTTYLSLAGRYSVLMPNTARGGGISRKITNLQDRKRLKEIARELEVPQGMGVILRTAGANRTKVEVKRDFEYLMRLWENVRTLTLNSTAPCLVYEEGSLIKRSIRDLYSKEISEIVVAGDDGYREAKDFMKMLMPSHAKVVQPYRDVHPIFSRSGIEAQLDRMLQPQVTLKSGGYIIINQTEALVAIDVNSGRSTREYSIEDTALQTNLEAAEEVARQLRLRDLAGLIVIDFIDMEEKRNNRSVEKRLKDCLKNDRARIQVGRISHFGLLEMSRQRIRASVLESTMQVCSHCGGNGHVRSQSSVALHVLRGVEEYLLKNTTHDITVRTTPDNALYLLNHKRGTIVDFEHRFGVSIVIDSDGSVGAQHFAIDRGEPVENPVKIENILQFGPEPDDDDPVIEDVEDEDSEEAEVSVGEAGTNQASAQDANGDDQGNRKRKRRRRRRGGNRVPGTQADGASADEDNVRDASGQDDSDEDEDDAGEERPRSESANDGQDEAGKRKRRRRGKRGGRRNRDEGQVGAENGAADSAGSDMAEAKENQASDDIRIEDTASSDDVDASVVSESTSSEDGDAPVKAKRGRKAKVVSASSIQSDMIEDTGSEAKDATPVPVADKPIETATQAEPEERPAPAPLVASEPVLTSNALENEVQKPKKGGWWQKRGFF